MNKLTATQAVQSEIESIKEALGNCIELNDEFVGRHCSQTVAEQLLRVDESDRESLVQDNITHAWANGSPASNADGIWVECSEIEVQIESEDDLDDPTDWTVSGDCAYYYVGYGISFDVNTDQLARDVDQHFADLGPYKA